MDSQANQAPGAAPAPAAPVPQSKPVPGADAGGYISNPYGLIKPSLEAFKLAWLNLLLMILAFIGATLVLGVIVGVGGAVGATIGFILAVPLVILGTSYVGFAFTKVVLNAARGKKLTFKEALPTSLAQAWHFFVVSLLTVLVVLLGFVLFIVPGIIFLTWFGFSTLVLVEEGVGGTEALKRSRDLVKGRFWEVLGAFFMPSSLAIIMLIPFLGVILYFVATVILMPLTAVRYVQLKDLKKRPDWDKVPVSPLNYVALVVGLIASGISNASSFNKSMENSTQQLEQQYKVDYSQ